MSSSATTGDPGPQILKIPCRAACLAACPHVRGLLRARTDSGHEECAGVTLSLCLWTALLHASLCAVAGAYGAGLFGPGA